MKNTDKKLNDVAEFLDKQIEKLESLKEKDIYCENCKKELFSDDLDWLNDQPICPFCETFIEL